MLNKEEVHYKLLEWSEVTKLAMILQKEAYKVGLNDLSVRKRLNQLGYLDEEIERTPEYTGSMTRAVDFICRSTDEPLMQWSDYDGGYDVRGWGYIYALDFLCDLQSTGSVPEGMDAAV